MTPSVPAYVSETLYLGLRLKPVERIQTVQQLFRALSEREYAEELSRSMEALVPPAPAPQEPKAPAKAELLSVRNLLAGIVILLSVLILLILWGLLSRQSEKPPEVIAPESVSEAASEPVNENVTLTPDLVGRDYDAEVRNNHSYIDEYLFYVYYFQGVQLFRKHVAGSEEHQNQGDNLILFHNWFYFGCKVTRNLQYVQS